MTNAERRRMVESRSWRHSIDLGDGLVTPGLVTLDHLNTLLGHVHFPESFAGRSVLDVGAGDGFFSFEAEKRGATRVVACDVDAAERYGFAMAKHLLASDVEYVQSDAYALSPDVIGRFDVVFFFGILEQLRYPWLALDRIWEVTDQYVLMETHHLDNHVVLPDGTSCTLAAIDPRLMDMSLLQFYRSAEAAPGSLGRMFAFNRRALEDGLWSGGFRPEFLGAWNNRIAFRATKLPGVPEYRRHSAPALAGRPHADYPSDVSALRHPWGAAHVEVPEFSVDTEPTAKFDHACAAIREPKKKAGISYAEGAEDRIVRRLLALGFDVRPYEVDVADYRRYVREARYVEKFPHYYAFNRWEKALEHYVAAKLLALGAEDVYIDIASEHSPVPDIYQRLFGVRAYRQDLTYPPGIHEDMIGGDAAHMPVSDGFAAKMALHCSFEHFEKDSDVAFVREIGRVLRPGGAVCVVPLYLSEDYAIQTDPEVAVPAGVVFEHDATVYCAQGWGNRHGRFYDPEHLAARILSHAGGMALEVYRIVNAVQVDPSCYARFAMLIRKGDGLSRG